MSDAASEPGQARSDGRASKILETMATGYFELDAEDRIVYINALGERILRRTRDELLGNRMWDVFPEAEHLAFGQEYRQARLTGEQRVFEAWAPRLRSWVELRVVPAGQRLGVYLLDVTDRHDAAEQIAAVNERLRLVAEAATELSTTLDTDSAVGRLARLVVPRLADWALVTLVEDDGSLRDLGSAHRDPGLESLVAHYASARLAALLPDSYLFRVADTGLAEVVDTEAGTAVAVVLRPGEARDGFCYLNPAAMAIVPMRARGRTVGLLSLYSETAYGEERLQTAALVAERSALAVDNARAYARVQAAQAAAETTARHMRLLGDVSELLATAMDDGLSAEDVARLVVPELADWSIVNVAGRDGLDRDVGWSHRDAARDEVLGRYAHRQYDAMSEQAAMAVSLRTGEPVIVRELPDALLDGWLGDATARAELAELRPGSVAAMPLRAAGQTFGVLALVTSRERGPHTPDELDIASEVARRAGLALDNARLYGRQRQLAEALQRSLLTAPPSVPGLQVAVRYEPAAAEAQVGGDWYDAFRQVDGRLVLCIGDVVGHDSQAAAAMSQVRGLLRGIGYTTGAGPAALLHRLDEAIDGLAVGTTATAVVVRVDPTTGDAPVRLTWSNAGHPPPMTVTRDRVVGVLERAEADLLLGIEPATRRMQGSVELAPGTTLLLYTDGLVERRGVSLDDGLDDLKTALRDFAHLPLPQLCDQVIARLLPPGAEDDVALVAVRVGS